MKKISHLLIAGILILIGTSSSFSQQTSTLKLKFNLVDSLGNAIAPDNPNYLYVDSWNGDEMPLNTNNSQIKFDTISKVFIAHITVPRYKEYSFGLKNKNTKESMVFRIFMDGNLSEYLTFDEIQFTSGVFVFNLASNVNYYNTSNFELTNCTEKKNVKTDCIIIEEIDWDASHLK